MTSFSSARLGVLFRQRAQLTDDLRHAHAKAERLALEYNELVRKAGQAATDGGRQRTQLQASRKGEEAARAREHADALSRQRHEKETEIADLIGAVWAASQSLLSADMIRQLNDHLGAISDHLEQADGPVVFFKICDSESHARAAAQFADATIGIHGQMHDTPARHLAASPYSGLAFGNSVKRAFHQACATIGDEPDSVMPQLFFRHGIDPHTVVLVRPEEEGGGTP